MGKPPRFRSRSGWKQRQQLRPERVGWLKLSASLRHMGDHGFTSFQPGQPGDLCRIVAARPQHRRPKTERLGMVTQGRIQQGDGQFLIR